MTTHTPGPWAVHPTAPMAVHQPELQCWIPQNDADARLIAAAPALLEALKRYVHHFGDPLKCARAAIAMAEGDKSSAAT